MTNMYKMHNLSHYRPRQETVTHLTFLPFYHWQLTWIRHPTTRRLARFTPLQEESLFTNSPSHSTCAVCCQAMPLCVLRSSLHLLFCRPLFLVPFLGVQLVVLHAHLLSCLLARGPSHRHFFDLIVLIIFCTPDLFLRSSFVTLSFFVLLC